MANCQAGIIGSLTRNHCRDLAELEAQLKAVTGLIHDIPFVAELLGRLRAEYLAACAIPDMAAAARLAQNS